jgi:hypothetical protein
MGIEPTLAAWEAAVLPLNYTRLRPSFYGPAVGIDKCGALRPASGRSERIIDAAEYRGLAAGKTEIQVADDEGIRHAA